MSFNTLNPLGGLNKDKISSSFNESTPGGKMLDEGRHDVTIESIEQPEGKPYLRVRVTNESGQYISDSVFLTSQDGTELSRKFVSFLRAATGTSARAQDLFSRLEEDFSLIQALTGLRVNVKVDKGRQGYEIVSDGGLRLRGVDPETQKILDENFEGKVYDDYRSATAAVDLYNASVQNGGGRLYRAYNRVSFYNRRTEQGDVDANVAALQTAYETAAKTGSSAPNTFDTSSLLG
jgi:hypothetical protein